MPRRRIIEEPVSHERWLVSYADFITLLFAFFVVMYSISQVNEGKYKVLSETLTDVFQKHKAVGASENIERRLDPIQVGEIAKSNPLNFIELEDVVTTPHQDAQNQDKMAPQQQDDLPATLEQINVQLEQSLGDLLAQDLITVRGNEEWLEVELKSSLLFPSGDVTLSTPAMEILGSIADILRNQDNPIRVEGFTDNVPISTAQFPSNWELSSYRASTVVQLFIEEGLAANRLAAIGYGEFQPIADNNTEQGRAANRRVVLMISKSGLLRPQLRDMTSPQALSEQAVNQPAGNTGIEIIIPGVDAVPDSATIDAQLGTNESAGNISGENAGENIEGVRTIELDDGGLLFTNDAPRADDLP